MISYHGQELDDAGNGKLIIILHGGDFDCQYSTTESIINSLMPTSS